MSSIRRYNGLTYRPVLGGGGAVLIGGPDGMQRVDQDEAGCELTRRPGGQVRQIMQVAVAPGAARADGVELDGQAPGPVAGQAGLERGARRARVRAWLASIRLLGQRFD